MSEFEQQLRTKLAATAHDAEAPIEPSADYFRAIARKRHRRLATAVSATCAAAVVLVTGIAINSTGSDRPVQVATATSPKENVISPPAGETSGPATSSQPAPESTSVAQNRKQSDSSPASDDVAASRPARSVNDLVAQHPDVFVGVYGERDLIIAVVEQGVDVQRWEDEVRRAASPSPTRVETCRTTIEQLNDVRRDVAAWAAERSAAGKTGLSFGIDPKTCTTQIHGQLSDDEKSDLKSRHGDLVSFQDRIIQTTGS